MMKAILMIGILAVVSGSTDTFYFTRCECPSFEFNSAQKRNFPNPLVISGNSALFHCSGNGSFPDASGLIVDVTDANSRLSTSGVDTSLFGKIVEGTKKGWNAAFRISFVPDTEAVKFNLLEIFNNGRSVYKIPFFILSLDSSIIIRENFGISLDIPYVLGEEVTLDVMVGDVFSTSIGGGETTIDLSFVCASINNENVNCKAGIAPIVIDLDSASNIELLKSTAGSSPLQVSVLSAEFNNDGATDGISVNNLQEFLVELARRSTQIIAQMPHTKSLLIPKEKTLLNPVEVLNEKSSLTFSLGQDKYGQRLPGAEDVPNKIQVTKLPGIADGILKDSDDDFVNLNSNSEFSDLDSLKFIPSQHVFNAVDGSPVDASGELLGKCNRRVTINEVAGYCAISFEYKVFIGGVESPLQEAFFLVNAIDDGKPIISVRGQDADTVDFTKNSSSNAMGIASISDVQISSDNGANAFQVLMQIRSINGVKFKVKDPKNPQGSVVSDGVLGDEEVDDCNANFCDFVKIRGTVAQLEEMASLLEITVPLTALDPSMTLTVADLKNLGSGQISIKFRPENKSESSNAGIIVGTLLAVTLVSGGVGFVVLRKNKQKQRSSETKVVDNKTYSDL